MPVHAGKPDDDPKKRRRRMTKFRIDEISLVDRGAQAAAGFVIAKRDVAKVLPKPRKGETRKDFVSRFMSDEEARREFPDQSQRAAVANRQFGKQIVYTVEQDGTDYGQPYGITTTGTATTGTGTTITLHPAPVAKNLAVTSLDNGHRHTIALGTFDGDSNGGHTSWDNEHAHVWVRNEDGSVTVFSTVTPGDTDAHTHTVEAVSKSESSGGDEPAGSSETDTVSAGISADSIGDGEIGMTKKEGQSAATETAADDVQALKSERDAAIAKAERFEKIATLGTEERAYFDSLAASEQDGFLGLADGARRTVLEKAAEKNPVVYTSKQTGQEFRKSDSPALIALAKQNDELAERLAKADSDREHAVFAKRAQDELPHLKGSVEVRAAILKAIDGIEDEELRKGAHEALRAQDLGVAELLKRRGTTQEPADGSPEGRLDALAKQYASDHKVGFEEAYAKVLDTSEGASLYNQQFGYSPNGA